MLTVWNNNGFHHSAYSLCKVSYCIGKKFQKNQPASSDIFLKERRSMSEPKALSEKPYFQQSQREKHICTAQHQMEEIQRGINKCNCPS